MERKNLDIYGHAPISWSRALKQLAANSGTYWLATTRPGAGPHLAAVGALWVDGNVYFTSGPRTRKSRDIAKNPRCVVSVSLKDLDLVIEGSARKVRDEATLKRLAKRYAAQGWPAIVKDGAFTYEYSAPSAGPPPWDLYVIAPVTAFGVATAKPHGATRWQFGAAPKVKKRAAKRS
jgi:Pyridoxamine 5'-phosphate oxidase